LDAIKNLQNIRQDVVVNAPAAKIGE
jgi:hypothetical protein